MNKCTLLLLLVFIACAISSCNVWRRGTGKRKAIPASDSTVVIGPADSGSKVYRDSALARIDSAAGASDTVPDAAQLALLAVYRPLWEAQTAFSTFSGKAKVQYEGKGESHDLSATIRIEKDRKIWVSITALGLLEVARALITPDSIIAIDRIHKEVRMLPFAEAGKVLPAQVDFATLQSLIVGGVLRTAYPLTKVTDTVGQLFLTASSADYVQRVTYSKSDTTISAQSLAARGALLQGIYFNYALIGGRQFPNNRDLTMSDKGETHFVKLEFSRAVFDEPVDMGFSIPAKYERK